MFPKMKSKIQVPSQLWKLESIFFHFSIFHHQKIKSIGHRDWSRHKHKHKQNKKNRAPIPKHTDSGNPPKCIELVYYVVKKQKTPIPKFQNPPKLNGEVLVATIGKEKKKFHIPISLNDPKILVSFSGTSFLRNYLVFIFWWNTITLFVCLFGYFSLCCYFIYVVIMCIWESIYNSPASAYSFWEIPIKFILFYFC